MKTPQEVEALKANWLHDPCYDIESVEGFEDHVDELRSFQQVAEINWERRRQKQYENLNKVRTPADCRLLAGQAREEIHDAYSNARGDRELTEVIAAGLQNLVLIGGEIAAQLSTLNYNIDCLATGIETLNNIQRNKG